MTEPCPLCDQERLAELQYEAGMYKSLYENAVAQQAVSCGDLAEKAKKCALYDFDTVEMVECKWALWQDIINALSTLPSSTRGGEA